MHGNSCYFFDLVFGQVTGKTGGALEGGRRYRDDTGDNWPSPKIANLRCSSEIWQFVWVSSVAETPSRQKRQLGNSRTLVANSLLLSEP